MRFQHVFTALLALSALTAFGIPPRYLDKFDPQLSALFAPVARPAGAVGSFLLGRLSPDDLPDRRASDDIRRENQSLKISLAALQSQVEELQRRVSERERLGPVGNLCTIVKVVGGDPGPRESLALEGSVLENLRDGMPVLYPFGVVGLVSRSGIAGVQVRLITDLGVRERASFGLFRKGARGTIEFVRIDTPTPLVEGVGRGAMVVRGLTMESVRAARLTEGNWVVLKDADWPALLQGQRLGSISKIAPRTDAPLYAEIRIEPAANLLRLREVMVLNKER